MSVTNPEIQQNSVMGNVGFKGRENKDHFSFLHAGMLIVLTLVVSMAGWYVVGKYFFWQDVDMKRINQQLEFLQKRVEAEPKNLNYRVGLGYTYFLQGDNEKAVRELNQVLEIDRNYYDAHYNLGLVYSDEGRLDDALETFQKAIEISPKDYKGHMQMGIVYRKLQMYDEAMESLARANKLMPRRADIVYEIGMVAEAKGDLEMAAGIYKDALTFDPLFKEAARALKRVQK